MRACQKRFDVADAAPVSGLRWKPRDQRRTLGGKLSGLAVASAPTLEIVDLRASRDDALLEVVYEGLYSEAFPVSEEREDLDALRTGLWGDDERAPVRHFFVGRRDEKVVGLGACEYYRRSSCGLLSYLAVVPEARGMGIGRSLLDACTAALHSDAGAASARLHALFAEVHDPARIGSTADSMAPLERLRVMARYGAKRAPIAYVQPELAAGRGRGRALMLLAFPLAPGRDLEALPSAVVKRFLEDLYLSLGVKAPLDDLDFVRSLVGLNERRIELEELTPVEEPLLPPATSYGVAVHCAVRTRDESPVAPASPELASFEEDMLAYSYPERPPFATRTIAVPNEYARVAVEFPGELTYESEGRLVTLRSSDGLSGRARTFLVRASRTDFVSGVSILHLVLGPDPGASSTSALNEYDLIKLMKLWQPGEGLSQDGIDAAGKPFVQFRTHERALALKELVEAVFGETVDDKSPRVGTIQVIHEICATGLCDEIAEIVKRQGSAETPPHTVAVGGLVQGLLDFQAVDADELADVFKEVELEEQLVRAHHKGSLLVVSASDRAFSQPIVQLTVGVSPYLLVPQAVLLHNEWWLWEALNHLDAVRGPGVDGLRRLPGFRKTRKQERARRDVSRALSRFLVPNVFQYAEEKNLYEKGRRSRGLHKRQTSVEARLEALTADNRARHGQIRSAAAQSLPVLALVFTWLDSLHNYPHAVVFAVLVPVSVLTLAALAFAFWRE
jgi:GNAT superfamily N-acetyltransferase